MTNQLSTENCRKCGAKNPSTNQYCANCGAILLVSTSMMKAQPKAVVPFMHSFQKRWLLAAVFVILGIWVISILLIALFTSLFFNAAMSDISFGEGGIQTSVIKVGAVSLVVTCVLFFFTGVVISTLAKDNKTAETVVAAIIVSIFIGVSGSMVSSDFLLAAVLLGIPGTVAMGLGARTGGKKFMRRP